MAAETLIDVQTQLETLFCHGTLGSLTDGELLARFLNGDAASAEAAFAILVDRHGSMVMRVCRSALGTTHDAEDVSQAVFLVLAHRARSVRRRDSAASWLYGVTRRVAARARRDDARRRKHERRRAEMAARQTETPVVSDACEGIYEEIDALPEIYRSALVLCYLEGQSHEQAAARLRCPLRTLQSRLLRARERLRERLARRGASLPAVLPPLAKSLSPSAAWVKTTAEAARAFAAGQAPIAKAGVSSATISLAKSSLRTAVHVPRLIAGAFLTAGLAVVVVAVSHGRFGTDPPPLVPMKVSEARVETQPEKDPNNRPWGLIEGMVKIGSRPAVGVQIRLYETDNRWAPNEAMPITQAQQQSTDARGRYRFERVIPARLSVSRIFTLERSSFHVGTGAARTVTVKPGGTTLVDLGGTGRAVVGRFALPAGIKAGAIFPSFDQTLRSIRPEPPYPADLDGKEREAWLAEWLATDEGEAYSRTECVFDTNVRPDGRFRIEDVPAGKYQLHAQVHEPGTGVPGTFGPERASIDTEIVVPEIPGGRSDVPLDVGTIELKLFKPRGSD